MRQLEGTTALVTGAAAGIGHEVARQLAQEGAVVLVSARSADKAQAAAQSLARAGDVRALPVGLDVADEAAVRAAADAIERDPGRLDLLVNNAAAFVDWTETASAAKLDDARRVLETNLFGAWRTTAALLPLLRRSTHPRVVMVSSGAGSHGDEQFGLDRRGGAAATYGISKAALNALTSTLAAELADTRVVVTAACPGLTATWEGAEQMGARPVRDGAASVMQVVRMPGELARGGLFRDGRPLPW